jgi:hypothetical protein
MLIIPALLTATLSLYGVQASNVPKLAPGSPEEVASKAADAAGAGRYDEFAKLMDPAALKSFHDGFTGVFELALKSGKSQVVDQILPVLFGIKTLDAFKTLDDAACFAAFTRAVAGQVPNLKEGLKQARNEVLGKVDETKDTTHVLCRLRLGGPAGEAGPILTVMSLRHVDGAWKLLLSGNVDAMMATMKQAIAGAPPATQPAELTVQPLGRVPEGPDTVHVVYRPSRPSPANKEAKVSALTVTRDDPDWDRFQGTLDPALGALIKKKVPGLE